MASLRQDVQRNERRATVNRDPGAGIAVTRLPATSGRLRITNAR